MPNADTLVVGAAPNWLTLGASLSTGSQGVSLSRLTDPTISQQFRFAGTSSVSDTWISWNCWKRQRIGAICLPAHNGSSDALWRCRLSNDPAIQNAPPILHLDYVDTLGTGTVSSNVDAPTGEEVHVGNAAQGGQAAWGSSLEVPASAPGDAHRIRVRLRPYAPGALPHQLEIGVVLEPFTGGEPWAWEVLAVLTEETSGVFDLPLPVDLPGDSVWADLRFFAALTDRDDEQLGEAGWVLEAVDWVAEPPAPTGTRDSGLRPMLIDPITYSGLTLSEMASQEMQKDGAWILLDEKGRVDPGDYQYGRIDIIDPRNPAGYVSAGHVAAGPVLPMLLQRDFSFTFVDPTVVKRINNRGLWRRPERPYIRASFPVATESQGLADLRAWLMGLGRSADYLVAALPSSNQAPSMAFWATLAEEETEISYAPTKRNGSDEDWSWHAAPVLEQVT